MASPMFGPPSDPDLYLKSRKMELDSGTLGRLFGSRDNAPINIAGFSVFLILTALILFTFVNIHSNFLTTTLEFWKICIPVITLILGFLFGKKD